MSGCPLARGQLSADSVFAALAIINIHVFQLLKINSRLGTGLALSGLQGFLPFIGDMIMKFETLMLRGLFIACLAVCGMIFGAMVTATPTTQFTASNRLSAILMAAPSSCALPPDGVVCPQPRG
jgi:hypothetical protein